MPCVWGWDYIYCVYRPYSGEIGSQVQKYVAMLVARLGLTAICETSRGQQGEGRRRRFVQRAIPTAPGVSAGTLLIFACVLSVQCSLHSVLQGIQPVIIHNNTENISPE